MIPSKSDSSSPVLFDSTREGLLRWVTVIGLLPLPLTAWLISRVERSEWENAPFGPDVWWLLPTLLLALSSALPAGLFYLHGRYVLRLERTADGFLRLTTFLVWGRRTRLLPSNYFENAHGQEDEGRYENTLSVPVHAPSLRVTPRDGRPLIFDRQGEAPQGWHIIDQFAQKP